MKTLFALTTLLLTSAAHAGDAPIVLTGAKALTMIQALSNGGIELTEQGDLSLQGLACHGYSGGGTGQGEEYADYMIASQHCFLEDKEGKSLKDLTESNSIVAALSAAGVEQEPAMAGKLYVFVDRITCKVDVKERFRDAKEKINAKRFRCELSGVSQ